MAEHWAPIWMRQSAMHDACSVFGEGHCSVFCSSLILIRHCSSFAPPKMHIDVVSFVFCRVIINDNERTTQRASVWHFANVVDAVSLRRNATHNNRVRVFYVFLFVCFPAPSHFQPSQSSRSPRVPIYPPSIYLRPNVVRVTQVHTLYILTRPPLPRDVCVCKHDPYHYVTFRILFIDKFSIYYISF